MGSKSPLVILMMVTLLCAIVPAALGAVLPPSAFAQQEETSLGEEEEEDLAGDNIVSDVLDSVEDGEENGEAADGDGDTNRQTAVPIIEQDQGAANLALNEALDVTVVEPRPLPTTTPPDDGGLEPECSLEITADKETYGPGDVVAITITNTGDVPLEFPDSALGLEIKNVDTGEVLILDAQPVVVTFEPGASATFQFTYESLVSEIGIGLISATVVSECAGVEVTFSLSDAPPEIEPSVEKIAFVSFRDSAVGEIYVMNAEDGSGQTRLTNTADPEFNPDWSPDGTKIAFQGGSEIYVMNADGSGLTKLTDNTVSDSFPSWSPDGTKIAFGSARSGSFDIYVMNADGTNPIRLTNSHTNFYPDWSPDGTKIVFSSYRNNIWDIYVMNADGSGLTKLTNNPFDLNSLVSAPTWSPDGTKIAFGRCSGGPCQVYVMNADGSGQTNISNTPSGANFPSWSPDGTKIAHSRGGEIYVMNADGSNPTNLTNHPATDSHSVWGPAPATD